MFARVKARGPGRYLIRDRIAPNAAVEAINVSDTVRGRLRLADTQPVGRSNGKGRFSFQIRARAGDLLRLRCRTGDRRIGPWMTVRVPPSNGRGSLPPVALFRI